MEEAFIRICEHLADHLWLQGLLVAAGTCFLEDAARCGVGLLVAAGHMGWWLAFVSMTAGGLAGDVGLYLIGRYFTQLLIRWRWVDAARLVWMESYFQKHAFKSVIGARFIPGARTVVYAAAGAVRYPMPRFTLMLLAAAVIQSLLFLQVAKFITEKILPYLRDTRLQVAAFAVVVLILLLAHHVLARRRKARLPASLDAPADGPA